MGNFSHSQQFYVNFLWLILNLVWDDHQQCNIKKWKKKHCHALLEMHNKPPFHFPIWAIKPLTYGDVLVSSTLVLGCSLVYEEPLIPVLKNKLELFGYIIVHT